MKKNYLIIFLLIVNLIVGLIITGDYGQSWDENNMRSYAEITTTAYEHFFQPEKMATFYDSLDDRQYYGPFYLMAGNAIVDFVHVNFHVNHDSIYHFYNYFTFQLGVLFFYLLNKRFFPSVVAFSNTLLFSYQPVLFGHAFINAKDIAIMVYFLGAVEIGLRLVDAIPLLAKGTSGFISSADISWKLEQGLVKKAIGSEKKLILVSLSTIALLVALLSFGFFRDISAYLVNTADSTPDSHIGRIFSQMAQNRETISLKSYIRKGELIAQNAVFIVVGFLTAIVFSRIVLLLYAEQLRAISTMFRQNFYEKKGAFRGFIKSRDSFSQYLKHWMYAFFESGRIWQLWLAAIFLGIISSIRLNGPYVGILISLLLIMKNRGRALPVITLYGVVSIIVMYIFWPYLWSAPVPKFIEAITYMTNFPWNETVLFEGARYKANFIPTDYLPKLLLAQFTEPIIFVVIFGFLLTVWQLFKKKGNFLYWFLFFLWGLLPLSITIFSHMRIYDNFRHIFFLIPPLLLPGGFAIDFFHQKLKKPFFYFLVIMLVAPGILSNIKMHPYEYVYYNSTVGGLEGAVDKYELDYLGTSLKEATEYVNKIAPYRSTVYIYAPFHLVSTFARPDLVLTNTMKEKVPGTTGYTVNLNRFYWGNKIFPDDKDIFQVKRGNAVFATVRVVQQ